MAHIAENLERQHGQYACATITVASYVRCAIANKDSLSQIEKGVEGYDAIALRAYCVIMVLISERSNTRLQPKYTKNPSPRAPLPEGEGRMQ